MTAAPDFRMDFYVKDFLASTLAMTGPEKGAYAMALIVAWTQGAALPENPERIGVMCGYTADEWREVWPALGPKWPLTANGTRRNPRQVALWEEGTLRVQKAHQKAVLMNEAKRAAERRRSGKSLQDSTQESLQDSLQESTQDSLLDSPSSSSSSSSSPSPEEKEKNREREGASRPSRARNSFSPPSEEEVRAFVEDEKLGDFNARSFVSHYSKKGWLVGRSPMTDWKAAVRNAAVEGWTTKKAPPDPPSPAEKRRREEKRAEQQAAFRRQMDEQLAREAAERAEDRARLLATLPPEKLAELKAKREAEGG